MSNTASTSGLKSKVILTLGLLFLGVLQYRVWLDDTGVVASMQLREQIRALSEDNAVDTSRNQYLLNEVLDFKRGTDMLEETAREELGLIKEGEQFFIFARPES